MSWPCSSRQLYIRNAVKRICCSEVLKQSKNDRNCFKHGLWTPCFFTHIFPLIEAIARTKKLLQHFWIFVEAILSWFKMLQIDPWKGPVFCMKSLVCWSNYGKTAITSTSLQSAAGGQHMTDRCEPNPRRVAVLATLHWKRCRQHFAGSGGK